MDKIITFNGKMDKKDFSKLFYYQTGSKLVFIIPIYFAIFAVLLFILKMYKSLDLSIILIILLSFIASVIFVAVYVSLLYSRLKKEFLRDLSKIKEQQYVLKEDRISIIVEGKNTDILLRDLKNVKDSKNFIILNHKANVMIAIPKRYINQEDLLEVREYFNKVKSSIKR